MTSRRRPRLAAGPLPLSLLGARVVEVAPTPGPSESLVTGLSARLPANPLRVARRGLRDKGRAALSTSATRGHRASVAPLRILAAFPATRWITLRPPARARSPGHVGHDPAAKWIRGTRPLKDNELSGVFSTAMACLGLYRDPVVARNTAESDFRIADLMNADAPVSLYLVVPPSDLARMRPIVRLILNQIGRRLTESMEVGTKNAYRHRLLLLLDEFPSLGRLEFFETALAFIAGYGLKAVLIAQSLNQLEKAYGPNNSILDNCHLRLAYAANDDRTARRISDLLGQATETRLQKSYSGSGLFLTHRSESEHEYGRPLLTPAEVNQLPQDDGILLVGGCLPYRARKVRYFLDPRFKGRGGLPPPDRPDEQARELLPRSPGEWLDGECVARGAPPGPPPTAPDRAAAPAEPEPHAPLNEPEVSVSADAGAPAVHDVWTDYFPGESPGDATAGGEEPEAAAPPARKNLPV